MLLVISQHANSTSTLKNVFILKALQPPSNIRRIQKRRKGSTTKFEMEHTPVWHKDCNTHT